MSFTVWIEMVAAAREFVRQPVSYGWTAREYSALIPFFSSTTSKVFFIECMPEQVSTALLAMYSRLKNPRGIRGNWVDNLLPSLLAPLLPECHAILEATNPNDRKKVLEKWLKERTLNSLDRFCDYSDEAAELFDWWLDAASGRHAWRRVADGERIRGFLQMWLDAYGHNSIARTGKVILCAEDGSIVVVKTLEWGRPGAGAIELSTRYVIVSSKGQYPIERELALVNRQLAQRAREMQDVSMETYAYLMGEKTDGPFPRYLRDHWKDIVSEKDLESGVFGEACDVIGNVLPSSTLTSVGVSMSAEAFPQHIKHLYLDGSPEGEALADFIVEEARRIGLGSFVRHERPTPWEVVNWTYLRPQQPQVDFMSPPDAYVKILLNRIYEEGTPYSTDAFERVLARITAQARSRHDKLPSQFESFDANAWGVMSFRGWRDLQRQSFCSHLRGRVTPLLGFYQYPKPAPVELGKAFERIHSMNRRLYSQMQAAGVAGALSEYSMALGNLIPYHVAGNARQWEFCNWQRSDFSVNDEVRQEFLKIEHNLRRAYPWWAKLSRADVTPHYVFARGAKGVVLP